MKILKVSYEEAKRLLSENREALDKIAAFLIEKETITGKEFMKIFHEVKGIPEPEENEKPEGESRMEKPETAEAESDVQPGKEETQPEKEAAAAQLKEAEAPEAVQAAETAKEPGVDEKPQNQPSPEEKPVDEGTEAVKAENPNNEDEMRGGSSFDRK